MTTMTTMNDQILREIIDTNLFVNCPECETIDDNQYQCTTCGEGGGYGRVSVTEFVQEQAKDMGLLTIDRNNERTLREACEKALEDRDKEIETLKDVAKNLAKLLAQITKP